MGTLILVRHGKAEPWADGGDRERPLARRGLRQSIDVGTELHELGWRATHVFCSPALRTRQTADQLAVTALAEGVPITYDERIYDAFAEDLYDMLSSADLPGDAVVLVVGHFPGLPELAASLDEQWTPRPMPTSGALVLLIDGKWASLSPGRGEVVAALLRD